MVDQFIYPTNAELMEIQRDLLPDLEADDVLLSLFPDRYTGNNEVIWEQEDNKYGAMQVRGLNGKPGLVTKGGVNQFKMRPGYYGDYYKFDEQELTECRKVGTFGDTVDLSEQVVKKQQLLMERRLDRKRQTISDLMRLGVFSNVTSSGNAVHSDSFSLTTLVPGTAWSNTATATPLKDLRTWKAQYSRNTSSNFGKTSQLIANTVSINNILNNTNANDLGGKRVELGMTLNTVEDINKLLAANDLPQLVEYNKSIQRSPDDRTLFDMIVPDSDFIWVGSRPNGQRVGEFQGTYNVNSAQGEKDGIYSKVIDRGENTVPRSIEVHHGYNGGLAVYYPTAIVAIRTS